MALLRIRHILSVIRSIAIICHIASPCDHVLGHISQDISGIHHSRESQIANFKVTVGIHQQISRLEVTVEDAG